MSGYLLVQASLLLFVFLVSDRLSSDPLNSIKGMLFLIGCNVILIADHLRRRK
jgi:hypothetical protein